MIPASGELFFVDISGANPSSESFKLDSEEMVAVGAVDGINAVKQAVFKMLNTERFQYPIYSWDYGVELADLFGEPYDYVCAELERRISEALVCDDRINSVDDFSFSRGGRGTVNVGFTVHSIFGSFDSGKAVNF